MSALRQAQDKQKITPFLWFDDKAEEAANLYTSLFDNSRVGVTTRYDENAAKVSGRPAGSVMTIEFELAGQKFVGLNGGPIFKFTPAISFLVACDTREEVDTLWKKLSEGGSVLMELGEYPFSKRYTWLADKYGLSWQIMFAGEKEIKQKITPTLMFVGAVAGQAEDAMSFYVSTFKDPGSKIGEIDRYGKGEEGDKEGTIRHASFELFGQEFGIMDSAHKHNFTFSEAISFSVDCKGQDEVDYFWKKLSAVPAAEQCGWLKDKFGLSWQIVPTILLKLLSDPDKEKAGRAMKAMLKMKKIEIAELEQAAEGR
ncbi:MAG: 3-demethylubiquinone-9 3-methyltransferase [Parcubacteria group bacterium GW2011_GWA2_51_10]|nr:MAG: 3-demethylubiquinone-9 3-methyltransferase [Parcubacteria group bacterium GW2011_GWA2_51_10]